MTKVGRVERDPVRKAAVQIGVHWTIFITKPLELYKRKQNIG